MTFMSEFTAVHGITLTEIMLHLELLSTCCLDTLPTSFIKSIFDGLAFEFLFSSLRHFPRIAEDCCYQTAPEKETSG